MIVSSYSFIDASTGDYQEEEVFYQEEEENFDHLTNQGKLTPMQARLMQVIFVQANIRAKVQSSTRARHTYLLLFVSWPVPSFILEIFYFDLFKLTFIVNFGLSIE